ncbi:lysophospholipid acyltransferase family protein [Verrucomicrobium spinosum]|uniref:lysophospholipid acyltransferase family protein n=1 Tax=Verrucomicrobium spinosum TaxID=2736 RepID=UPI0009467866|nr:lysophospholipid acyltransferase family protein [Verrucomicrobium spinosum]
MKLSYWLGYQTFKTLARGFFNYQVIGGERLNLKGGALIVSNHASFVDPPAVGIAFDEEIYYLARKSLMNNPMARAVYRAWNSIPVDQDRPDMGSLKAVIRLLKQGEKVLIFPEVPAIWMGRCCPVSLESVDRRQV